MTEIEIREIFSNHNVPLAQKDVWRVQGNPVVYHRALERLAAALDIRWDDPKIVLATDDHAVILVTGWVANADTREWSIGEAHVGVNYRIAGKQAAYPYAMAEKRAKDRVILKLARIEAYSEAEAEEFAGTARDPEPAEPEPEPEIRRNPENRTQSLTTAHQPLLRELELPPAPKPDPGVAQKLAAMTTKLTAHLRKKYPRVIDAEIDLAVGLINDIATRPFRSVIEMQNWSAREADRVGFDRWPQGLKGEVHTAFAERRVLIEEEIELRLQREEAEAREATVE